MVADSNLICKAVQGINAVVGVTVFVVFPVEVINLSVVTVVTRRVG